MNNEFAMEEFGYWIDGTPYQMKADVEFDHDQFKDMVHSMLVDLNNGQEKDVYFYHSDHLGSASWITDGNGIPVQHLQYLPFGEPFVDQHPAGYQERFRFTGKERDEETGYGYFGARYMDHELTAMWLSVDPMADKYPSISPYAYCAWNPVKLVDPDGNDWVVVFNHKEKTVTIEAKYGTPKEARESAENAIAVWNNLSGKYRLKLGKEMYTVNFNLSVIDVSEMDYKDPSQNTYRFAKELRNDNGDVDEKIKGQTKVRNIQILETEKDNFVTSSHEIGHSLGLLHLKGTKGLMEEDGGRTSHHHEILKSNVESIIDLSIHPEKRDPDWNSGKGSYREIGETNVNIKNPRMLQLLDN